MFAFSIERINFTKRSLRIIKIIFQDMCTRYLILLNNISAAPTNDIAKDTGIQKYERPRT